MFLIESVDMLNRNVMSSGTLCHGFSNERVSHAATFQNQKSKNNFNDLKIFNDLL